MKTGELTVMQMPSETGETVPVIVARTRKDKRTWCALTIEEAESLVAKLNYQHGKEGQQ